MTEPKYCINCRHFCDEACLHPKNKVADPVHGPVPLKNPRDLRRFDAACGPEGNWFERKEVGCG